MGQKIVLASAVRAASVNSADQNWAGDGRAMHVIIDMTAVPTVETVTFKVQGKSANDTYYDIITSAAIVAVSQVVLKIGVGLLAAANTVVNDGVPDIWRITATHSASGNFTYAVSASDID